MGICKSAVILTLVRTQFQLQIHWVVLPLIFLVMISNVEVKGGNVTRLDHFGQVEKNDKGTSMCLIVERNGHFLMIVMIGFEICVQKTRRQMRMN